MEMSPASIPNNSISAKTLWRTRLWTAFHVVVCLLMLYLWIMGSSENRLYQTLADKVVRPDMNREQAAVALLHTTHELLKGRNSIWFQPTDLGIRQRFLRGSDIELMVPGTCGSYSRVLVKSLQMAGFKARFCQMKVGETWGGHIIVEAEVEPGRWAVLDPLWGNSFKRPDGKLASFMDVQHNWDYYQPQLPPDYDPKYRYEDVRYTNWGKIPVVMPAARWVLSLFMSPQDLHGLCIRSYLTNIYYNYAIMLGVFYFSILLIRFFWWPRLKRRWLNRRGMKYDVTQVGGGLSLQTVS